jgi:acyl-CoA thioesterase FadM
VTWVVLRHEVDYLRPAFEGEEITVRTWEASGARSIQEPCARAALTMN